MNKSSKLFFSLHSIEFHAASISKCRSKRIHDIISFACISLSSSSRKTLLIEKRILGTTNLETRSITRANIIWIPINPTPGHLSLSIHAPFFHSSSHNSRPTQVSKPSRKIKLLQNFSRSIYPPYLKASGSSRWKINDPWVGEGSWKFQGRKFVSFTLGEKGCCSPRLREKSAPPLVVRDASTLWDGFPSDRCQGMQVTSTPSESNERTIAVVFENEENGGTNDWKNCRLIASLRGKKRKGCRRRDR